VKNTIRTIALVLATACLGWATTVRPMSVDRLTQLATSIVEAHVNKTWSTWDAQHSRIYTYTTLTVTKNLKGSQTSTITVKQPGGTVGHMREVVFGVRHFRPGEDAFLFLEPDQQNDGTFRVVGLMQGNFFIDRTSPARTIVTNGVPQVTAINSQGQLAPYSGAHMTLQELETRVVKAVTK
jgi:hypothetical protein